MIKVITKYIAVLLIIIPTQAKALNSWFPVIPGSKWVYKTESGLQIVTTTGSPIKHKDLTYIPVNTGHTTFYYLPLEDALIRLETTAGDQIPTAWIVITDKTDKGSSWKAVINKKDFGFFQVEGKEDVSINGEKYQNCLKITYHAADSPIPSAVSWYAPDIGPVKIEEHSKSLILTEYSRGNALPITNSLSFKEWKERFINNKIPVELSEINRINSNSMASRDIQTQSSPPPAWLLYTVPLLLMLFLGGIFFILRKYLITESQILKEIDKSKVEMTLARIQAGEIEQAIAAMEEAFIQKDTPYPDVLFAMGMAYEAAGKIEEALNKYNRALENNPSYTKPMIAKGRCLKTLGRFEEAEKILKEVLEQNPHYPDVHNLLGEVLTMTGKKDRAVWHFKEALRLNPNFKAAKENLEKLTA